MRPIKYIIVHCADTPAGREHTVADIRRWHVEERGWKDIGYHYLVRLDGTIEVGRPENEVGYHCQGHNADSIGVCYVGGKGGDTRTLAQKAALLRIIMDLHLRYPQAEILGHHDLNAGKTCPSFDAKSEYDSL